MTNQAAPKRWAQLAKPSARTRSLLRASGGWGGLLGSAWAGRRRRCGRRARGQRCGRDVGVDDLLASRRLLEVEHLADDAHEGFGGDAGHAAEVDAVLNGVAKGEERDRREVGGADGRVEALGVLDRIGSAHGGPHFLGFLVGAKGRPAAWAIARRKVSS